MSPDIELSIEGEAWSALPDLEGLAHRAIGAAAGASGTPLSDRGEVSLLFGSDERIRELNRAFRGIDKATNVLSFPAPSAAPEGAPLGDIAIAFETAAREADEEDKSLGDHVAHLLIHGFLHLLGFDHETNEEAEVMEEAERRALASIGIADPYRMSELEQRALP